jgi:hypothetical protein
MGAMMDVICRKMISMCISRSLRLMGIQAFHMIGFAEHLIHVSGESALQEWVKRRCTNSLIA